MGSSGIATAADFVHQVGGSKMPGTTPLGREASDPNPMVPVNYRGRKAIVYARNFSAVEKRTVIVDAVSFIRGGDTIQEKLAKRGQGVSLDKLHEKALNHVTAAEMSLKEDTLLPCVFIVEFDGKKIPIPYHDVCMRNPADKECKEHPGRFCVDAPFIIVDEGAWDLYCGNYDLMHYGTPKDHENELTRLRGKWGRFNRVYCDEFPKGHGMTTFAYVEFIREPIPEAQTVIETDKLFPGMLVEV
jgi:hypothetical protein